MLYNCKNIEDHTKTNHNINYTPLNDLTAQFLKIIEEKNENPIKELINEMPEGDAKRLLKAMMKAIQEEYSLGKY